MALPLLLFALLSGQEAVSTATPEPAPAAAAAAVATQAEYTPDGAPRDDYNFVAWCHGVLSGHMALAERVQPVLPLDEVQQKIGKAYLKGYEEALATGKRGRSAAELDAADAVRYAARANWTTAMKADMQLGADTYLAWQLPGRCEHAAKRVAGRTDLFRLAPTQADMESIGTGASTAESPVWTPSMVTPAAASEPLPAPARVLAPVETAPTLSVFTTAEVAPAHSAPAPADLGPAPAEVPVADVFTSTAMVEPADADAAPEEAAPAGDVFTFTAMAEPAADEPAEAGPAEMQLAAADLAPAPVEAEAEAEEAPKPEEAKPADRRIVRMPSKGRLFPWGKRE